MAEITDFKSDPKNHNKGTERGRKEIKDSIEKLGAGRSGLADADGDMLAGNHARKAAEELGLPVRVVKTTGDEFVIVQRMDVEGNSEKGRKLSYYDNLTQKHNFDLDVGVLAEDLAGGLDLSDVMTEPEIKELLGKDPEIEPKKKPKKEESETNVVLIFTAAQERMFLAMTRVLIEKWGMDDTPEVVLEALDVAEKAS